MTFVVLLSAVMVLSTCKKAEDTSAPMATTTLASWISQSWATLNGLVNARNRTTLVSFEYDTTINYGRTINAISDTLTGSDNIIESANLLGLKPSTLYHYRIKAVNSEGTSYGSDMTFTTTGIIVSNILFNPDLTYGSVSDNDGNAYKTIMIGTQTWIAENLRTTKLNDNTTIPLVTDDVQWAALTTPGYTWFNNDSVIYGAVYNWYAVSSGTLCPTGWHVPSNDEWNTLTTYLGGDSVAGFKLKEIGTTHWLSPNTGTTNESGFTALPGGYRTSSGTFNNIRTYGYWWSSTEYSPTDAYFRDMYYNYNDVDKSTNIKQGGFSVRCLKD